MDAAHPVMIGMVRSRQDIRDGPQALAVEARAEVFQDGRIDMKCRFVGVPWQAGQQRDSQAKEEVEGRHSKYHWRLVKGTRRYASSASRSSRVMAASVALASATSARARLRCWSASIRSSTVFRATSRCTSTGRV